MKFGDSHNRGKHFFTVFLQIWWTILKINFYSLVEIGEPKLVVISELENKVSSYKNQKKNNTCVNWIFLAHNRESKISPTTNAPILFNNLDLFM